jgi:hypothetical protein
MNLEITDTWRVLYVCNIWERYVKQNMLPVDNCFFQNPEQRWISQISRDVRFGIKKHFAAENDWDTRVLDRKILIGSTSWLPGGMWESFPVTSAAMGWVEGEE